MANQKVLPVIVSTLVSLSSLIGCWLILRHLRWCMLLLIRCGGGGYWCWLNLMLSVDLSLTMLIWGAAEQWLIQQWPSLNARATFNHQLPYSSHLCSTLFLEMNKMAACSFSNAMFQTFAPVLIKCAQHQSLSRLSQSSSAGKMTFLYFYT